MRWIIDGGIPMIYIYLMTVKQQASLVKEVWLKLTPQFRVSLLKRYTKVKVCTCTAPSLTFLGSLRRLGPWRLAVLIPIQPKYARPSL